MSRATQRQRRLREVLARRQATRLAGDTARQVIELEAAAPMRGGNAEPPKGGLFETTDQQEMDL